jgi:hypothetical protein
MITTRAIRINGAMVLDFAAIDDVQITNRHSRSSGNYYSYGKYGMRMGHGQSSSRSHGDIVFFREGNIVYTVHDVQDPHGEYG